MGRGIIVVGAAGVRPSAHFDGHLAYVVDPMLSLVRDFIDGENVTFNDPFDIIALESNGTYARVALVDTSVGAERAFVVALQARTAAELMTTPDNRDGRGVPTLLDHLHIGPRWRVFNCHLVDFTVRSRSKVYANQLPAR